MKNLALCLCAMLLSVAPAAGLSLVYAITVSTEHPPVTSIYTHRLDGCGPCLVYRDSDELDRVLIKMGGSDIVGAGRARAMSMWGGSMGAPHRLGKVRKSDVRIDWTRRHRRPALPALGTPRRR